MTEHLSTTPVITITDGVHLPVVGFGTYLISDDEVSDAVTSALDAGYRHVDTAEGYGNEPGVGRAINAALDAGLRRDELFVTTKLFPGNPAWGTPAKLTRPRSHPSMPVWRRASDSITSTSTSSTLR